MAIGPQADTLSPLPPVLRKGSIAIAFFAFVSFFTSLTLFVYLATKIVSWQLRVRSEVEEISAAAHDLAAPTKIRKVARQSNLPNQFLVLIFNLLLADLHQSTAFLLSSSWVAQDRIMVGTPACFVQGFFVSTGDLASSCFITAVAVHTYLSVVAGRRLPQTHLYCGIAALWIFTYAISLLPVAATRNGAAHGGWFVRAGAWCWINHGYENLRLLTHYLFIFIAIAVTLTLYTAIFSSLRRQSKTRQGLGVGIRTKHHPAFLAYPIIYLVCILPLALGRVATMAGHEPPLAYFCFAGVLTASNGWLDVILFASTRRSIVFAHGQALGDEDDGLNTFAFMRTPPAEFGNKVWVRGGGGGGGGGERPKASKGWGRIRGEPSFHPRQHGPGMGRSSSQVSLAPQDGGAIQMEVVTTVKVEGERQHLRRAGDSSTTLTDKEYSQRIKASMYNGYQYT
ncbi:hypothetical protein F4780DRAFT_205989 [Xylariomycetidae sp. FL0641]|nr:hypothetical protein F4780DRAFT_205989 [Xylariomycetidae sp. FL0641]